MSTNRTLKTTTALAVALAATLSQAAEAAQCAWTGGAGSYTNGAMWSCGAAPGTGDTVLIDNGMTGVSSVVSLANTTGYAGTLTVDAGDQVALTNSFLRIAGGGATVNGTISVAGASRLTTNNGAAVSLGGTGTILLDASSNYAQLGGESAVYTIGTGLTVAGTGQVGFDDTRLANNGVISANIAGGTLTLDSVGGSGGIGGGLGASGTSGFFNTATMQAANGGTLSFVSGSYENGASGLIRALAGSTVDLNNDVRIIGGTLASVGTGKITAIDDNQYLNGVTLASGSTLALNNDFVNINGTLTNNGTITLANASQLRGESGGDASVVGTGTITLDNSSNYALLANGGGTFTIGGGITVNGKGGIGNDSSFVVSNGLISATTGAITLDPAYGSGGPGAGNGVGTGKAFGFVNNSVLQATGAGSVLNFNSGRYDNSNGAIRAVNGDLVDFQNDVYILGGTVSGATQAIDDNQYFNGVTLASGSTLTMNNDFLNIDGTLTNNGTITLANASQIRGINGQDALLTGTGTVTLDNTQNYALLANSGGTFTIGSGITVNGKGSVGNDSSFVVSNGLISAINGAITLDPAYGSGGPGAGNGIGTGKAYGFVNNAVLQASGANAVLNFNSGRYDNSNGVIQAVNGGTVDFQNDVYILGGTVTGTGTIQAIDDNQYFNGVTLAGGSTLTMNNDFLNIDGTLTNNGTITLANASQIRGINGQDALLTGTGTVTLDNTQNYALLANSGGTFTIGGGITVNGKGSIGNDSSFVVSNGLISATTGAITLDPAYGSGGPGAGNGVGTGKAFGFVNNSVLQATGAGSVLNFNSGRYDNSNGAIRAVNGGLVDFQNDVYILGGTVSGATQAIDDNQYFNGVTLASGSTLTMNNDFLNIDGTLTNNGTITLANASILRGVNGSNASVLGSGTITLDNAQNYAVLGGTGGIFTIGGGITVNGRGSIGNDGSFVVNNGLISATTGTITLDPVYGSGGPGAGNGVGATGASGFFNTGTVQAVGSGAIAMSSGRYENSATGAFVATGGGVLTMNGDANLANIGAGGVLDLGAYRAIGAGSTLNLRGTGADSIATIGTAGTGTDTIVTLSGAGSALNVIGFNSGTPTSLDASLSTVAQTGRLELLAGRNFTVSANGGAFGNAGVVQLGGGTFTDASYANSGLTYGFGATGAIANTGTVEANGGTLATGAIIGAAGIVRVDVGATLGLAGAGGASSAGTLIDNGALALGGNNIVVTSDYQNANFGAGKAFNGRAGVSGLGLILATSATQTLSGSAYGAGTLNVGNVRVGQSTSAALTITNNGTQTELRGAVQNGNAPGVTLTNADFALAPNGGSSTTTIGFSGATAGSLAGQSLNVVNNFDNVSKQTVALQGNVYQTATAGAEPASITLAPVRAGSASSSASLTIQNVAPATGGFTESLRGAVSAGGGFLVNGGGSATTAALAPGASQGVTITGNTATAGQFTGTVSIANTSVAVPGSGLADLALPGQSVTVNSTVTQVATALLSNLGAGTFTGGGTSYMLDLGTLGGGASSTANLSVLNNILSSGYSEKLGGSFTLTNSAGYSFSGASFTGLPGGQSDAGNLLSFNAGGLSNGQYSTLLTFNGISGYTGLSDLALSPITITLLATVNNGAPPPTRTNAVASVSPTSVNFGVVRQGATDPTASVSVGNAASGNRADSLVTSVGSSPAGVSVTSPGALAAGQSGKAVFDLSTATPGTVSGSATLNFTSHDSTMADVALPSQSVGVTGTVTQLSIADILKSAGIGTLTGSGSSYLLDLGTVASGSSTSTTLGVLNGIPSSGYAESLGGGFALNGASSAYSFSGTAFSGLAAGATSGGNLLGFSTTGLGNGEYDALLTFNGTSSYPGLTNATLSPITVSIRALVNGAGGGGGGTITPPTSAVPEPGIWLQMLVGVGVLGGWLRRRRRAGGGVTARVAAA